MILAVPNPLNWLQLAAPEACSPAQNSQCRSLVLAGGPPKLAWHWTWDHWPKYIFKLYYTVELAVGLCGTTVPTCLGRIVHWGEAKPAQPPTLLCISWRDFLHICPPPLLKLSLSRSCGTPAASAWPFLCTGCRSLVRTSPGLHEKVLYFAGAERGTCKQYQVSSERNHSDFLFLQKVVRWH